MQRERQDIIIFGGGTGLSNLLRGMIELNEPERITAVPSGWDDGGSSGRLRDEMGALPPGDIRQCLLACMEDPEQKEVAQKLFDDRLADIDGPFKGHSLGNLVTARLERLYQGQDRGIEAARRLFRIRTKIYPCSLTDLRLIAKTRRGIEIQGETNIDNRSLREDFDPNDRIARLYFNTQAKANPEVLKELRGAEKIVFSAGDLYTSVIPHLLIEGVQESILASKAELYLVLNLMTKKGETDCFTAADHVEAFLNYLGDESRLNHLLVNDNHLDPKILSIYRDDGQEPVVIDEERCMKLAPSLNIVKGRFAKYYPKAHLLRHDSERLGKAILS